MAKEDSRESDPMSDVGEADVDALLEQTSELAAKAGEELGVPHGGDEPDPPAPDEKPAADDAPSSSGVSAPEDKPAADPSPDTDDKFADVDGKLDELEAMLDQMGVKSQKPVADKNHTKPKTDAAEDLQQTETDGLPDTPAADPATEQAPSAPPGDDLSDLEDYDDFDISVDLSDDEEQAAEPQTEAEPAASQESTDADADAPIVPLVDRAVTAPLGALAWLFVMADRPFANVSTEAKQVMGYIAIATLVVAVAGIVYGSLVS